MSFQAWYSEPARGDEVMACVASFAARFERAPPEASLRAGLPLDEHGRLPPDQIGEALTRVGLRARTQRKPARRWRADELPAILTLEGGRALVLHSIDGDQGEVELPFAARRTRLPLADLDGIHTGDGVVVEAVSAAEREAERPWDQAGPEHWFWSEVRKVRPQFAYVLVAALGINMMAFALPLFTMNVYDRIIPNRAEASLWVLAIGVALAIAFDFVLRLARTRLVDELGRSLDARLSQKVFDKILNLPLELRRGSTGALAHRVSEYEQVRDFFASTMVVLVVDLLFLFLFLGMITYIGGWLVLIPLAAAVAMGAAGFLLQRSIGRVVADAQADASLQQSALVEAIGGLETIKACGGEGRMLGRWQRYAATSALTQERLRRRTATAVNLASFCQQATNVGLVLGGFYLFTAGTISMGGIIAIVMLAGRSLAPVGQLAFLITRGRQAFATLDSLQKLVEQPDERSLGSQTAPPRIGAGVLQLDHVDFRYPDAGTDALSGIDLTINPGERIGLIGRVASGKSTLGRVLCGLYRPGNGSYAIDGFDSRQYSPHHLRRELRYVGQDSELFNGTVRENLLLGAGDGGHDNLAAALAGSGADTFIGRDALGLDLDVGERGSRLSGGQRSFLLLARALVEPCKLLFLDEPTGAMDTQSELLFVERLRGALAPRQTLVVSTHRAALLALVDRLIVIEQGRIIADGPKAQILDRAGLGSA
ncbi:MAG: type I secretion system permease/ATPase [Cypionkella sp.]